MWFISEVIVCIVSLWFISEEIGYHWDRLDLSGPENYTTTGKLTTIPSMLLNLILYIACVFTWKSNARIFNVKFQPSHARMNMIWRILVLIKYWYRVKVLNLYRWLKIYLKSVQGNQYKVTKYMQAPCSLFSKYN